MAPIDSFRAIPLTPPQEAISSVVGSLDRFMEHLPAAFAVTRGEHHALVFANAAFRKMVTLDGKVPTGDPIGELFASPDREEMNALMDRAFRSGVVSRNRVVEPMNDGVLPLRCTVWPQVDGSGRTLQLLIELRIATQEEQKLGLQRRVAERLLLSAMREQDAAAAAEASWTRATFLAAEGRRLTESLDEYATLSAMRGMSLPRLGAWCIVDTLDDAHGMHRMAIVHPDPQKEAALEELRDHWLPAVDDGFGLPAAIRGGGATVILEDADAPSGHAHDPAINELLRTVGVSSLLTVSLVIRGKLIGAVTFVGDVPGHRITPEDIALAEDLASRSAVALDRARLHGDAVASRSKAESANRAKSSFLGMMSHELRTPLNAIGGFVDLLDMELRGPINEAQHADLARIRNSQRYLLGLINDLLNLTKVESEHVTYDLADVDVCDAVLASVALLEPLFGQKQLTFDGITCEGPVVARADREKTIQILVNLLSNAIKFTPPGGHLRVEAVDTTQLVLVKVVDSGMGIDADKLDAIFDPFVQLNAGHTGKDGGTGLGLAISRDLARAMAGDLTADSVPGEGSTFTLALPRAAASLPAPVDMGTPDDEAHELEPRRKRQMTLERPVHVNPPLAGDLRTNAKPR